jgi:protein-tyrosine-phosphatase
MKVLFVCGANINRSQIAEAIFNKMSKKSRATSAGTEVGIHASNGTPVKNSIINNPVALMKKEGYDLSKAKVKKLTPAMVRSADKVILLRPKKKLGGILPAGLEKAKDVEWWDINSISDDVPFDEYCKLEKKRIKQIRAHVKELVEKIE